jgi:hypothetical protein
MMRMIHQSQTLCLVFGDTCLKGRLLVGAEVGRATSLKPCSRPCVRSSRSVDDVVVVPLLSMQHGIGNADARSIGAR